KVKVAGRIRWRRHYRRIRCKIPMYFSIICRQCSNLILAQKANNYYSIHYSRYVPIASSNSTRHGTVPVADKWDESRPPK
ncbi:MAG: hypothetical protein ACPLSA_04615, partial [Caldanaerobacter sp.]